LRVDLPAEDLLNIKKGWLMKQGLNKVRLAAAKGVRDEDEYASLDKRVFLSRSGTSTGLF
jgi:hypothetical protein